MIKKKIIIPVPTYGFDPTEVAIPWKVFTENNIDVVFATPKGKKAQADKVMLTGAKLGIWKSVLRARADAVAAYKNMSKSKAFCRPIKYSKIIESDFDAIYLPGGHDKGMKEYLESNILQNLIVEFFNANKTVGAICHGVVLVSRSINPKTNKSVIYDYKTTGLLKSQELTAHKMTKLWLKDYYRTYPNTTVEDEVKAALSDKNNFIKGSTPLLRDSQNQLKRGFTVIDKNYVSARWPGDVYGFSNQLIKII